MRRQIQNGSPLLSYIQHILPKEDNMKTKKQKEKYDLYAENKTNDTLDQYINHKKDELSESTGKNSSIRI
mgnify:CR=1 FL=1